VAGQNAVPNFDPSRLRDLRHAAGLTQVELALRAGLPPHTVVQYENGHRSPFASRLAELADALGVSPAQLTSAGGTTTLSQLRINAGLTQRTAADRAGLVRTRYSAIERGEIAAVDDVVMASIAEALGVSVRQARIAHAEARASYLAAKA
jgi:transcriptional regulator with XRE-family HTH domain